MLTIRRLYLYAMSGVTLAILGAGLRLLVAVLIDSLGLASGPALGGSSNREQLSLAGALVGVGLPVWAIHWALVRRSLRGGDADAEIERTSTVRAAYLSIVLAVSLLLLAAAAADLLRLALQVSLDLHPEFDAGADVAGATATILVAGAAWAFHAFVRRSDMAAGPLGAGAVLWPRLYLYGTQLAALFVAGGTFGAAVGAVADKLVGSTDPGAGNYLAYTLPSSLASAAIAGVIFVTHAVYARRLIGDPGWRGASERASWMRAGFLAILLGAGVAFTVSGVGEALKAILLATLGGTSAELGPAAGPGGLPRATLVPLVALLPWLGAALHGRRQLLDEAHRSNDPGRAAAALRLDRYITSAVGLAFGAVGFGWLLGLAIDALLGGNRMALSPDGWRFELGSSLPNAVLGLALWAWRWWEVTGARGMNPVAEASSRIRRTALLAILGVSLTVGVAALAVILYRLFGSALGVGVPGSLVSELSTPAGALIMAAAVALYHGLLVRADTRLRTGAGPEPPMPAPVQPATPSTRAERRLRLTAASPAELDAALAAARSVLPPGTALEAD